MQSDWRRTRQTRESGSERERDFFVGRNDVDESEEEREVIVGSGRWGSKDLEVVILKGSWRGKERRGERESDEKAIKGRRGPVH